VYWVVNLIDRQVEVHSGPTGPGDHPDYAARQIFQDGDTIPVVLDGNQVGKISVNDLLP
jgi:hypothetical protein